MRSKAFKKLLAAAVIVTSLLISVGSVHAVGELDLSSCLDAGGATSWMSCPMIDTVQKTVNGIFVNVLQGWLEIEPELFKHLDPDSPGSSVFSAWQYFQGIANIALVIYLFIIILSQFTGIGISNYGIKKALPRVLLCAVLVNLSYIICQIAVDASNIVGGGVRALFDKLIENSALVARGTQDTGITIAIVAVVIGLLGVVIVLMKVSPVFIIPCDDFGNWFASCCGLFVYCAWRAPGAGRNNGCGVSCCNYLLFCTRPEGCLQEMVRYVQGSAFGLSDCGFYDGWRVAGGADSLPGLGRG